MRIQVTLTVAEGKRLIAKAVATMDVVRTALKNGLVVIAKGTTNAYVVEEILSTTIDRRSYRSGVFTPQTPDRDPGLGPIPDMPDIVLRDGRPLQGLDRFTAAPELKRGDVYIKGANAVDSEHKLAGIFVGDPKGGTIGAVLGHIVGKKVNLVVPVGLEKRVCGNLAELARRTNSGQTGGWGILPVAGEIVTEIEAVRILSGATASLVGAGGIAGAEGCVCLLIEGEDESVEKASTIMDSVKGEPRLVL